MVGQSSLRPMSALSVPIAAPSGASKLAAKPFCVSPPRGLWVWIYVVGATVRRDATFIAR
jgi:hypothetical protein